MTQFSGFAAMAAAADAGHFAVDPVSGAALGASIADMRTELQIVLSQLATVKQRVPLGTLPEAEQIAGRNVLVATGDHQSAEAVLQQFDASLEAAERAVRKGMTNYSEVEEDSRRRVTPA
jgi:hypothetical protein